MNISATILGHDFIWDRISTNNWITEVTENDYNIKSKLMQQQYRSLGGLSETRPLLVRTPRVV